MRPPFGRLVTIGIAAAALAVLTPGLTAQQTGQPPPPSQQPVFRGGSDLVSVYVVAVDAADQPVHGLTKDNFTVTDRKKPQQIEVFDEISHEERRRRRRSRFRRISSTTSRRTTSSWPTARHHRGR
jgi:hypothetical protein